MISIRERGKVINPKVIDQKLHYWAGIKRKEPLINLGYTHSSWQDLVDGSFDPREERQERQGNDFNRIDGILIKMSTSCSNDRRAYKVIDNHYVSNLNVCEDELDWSRKTFGEYYYARG